MYERILQHGIDPYLLAEFLQNNIDAMREIQNLDSCRSTEWLKRELELTHAEKLLMVIRKDMYHH